jgi:hypothetical protein
LARSGLAASRAGHNAFNGRRYSNAQRRACEAPRIGWSVAASISFYFLGLRLHFVRRTPEFVSGKSLLKMQKPADL